MKQESLWYWCEKRERQGEEVTGCGLYPKNTAEARMLNAPDLETFSAFTVAELGEKLAKAFNQLPGTLINDPSGRFKRLWINLTGFENEAENRAKMLVYLIENNLIEIKEK